MVTMRENVDFTLILSKRKRYFVKNIGCVYFRVFLVILNLNIVHNSSFHVITVEFVDMVMMRNSNNNNNNNNNNNHLFVKTIQNTLISVKLIYYDTIGTIC